MILTAYYGLLCVGEITKSRYNIKARDLLIADEKQKVQIYLRSSKFHNESSSPQIIEIDVFGGDINPKNYLLIPKYCPFKMISNYTEERGPCDDEDEPLFIFSNRFTAPAQNFRRVLHRAIASNGLNHKLYNWHSLRSGRVRDLEQSGAEIEKIHKAGRWHSHAFYKYLPNKNV